jgi:hypothetical protein
MENLSLDNFSPKKNELIEAVKRYEDLKINNLDDLAGYNIVNEARKDLQKKRIEITTGGKQLRDGALQFQRNVIKLENELVAIIEPAEKRLKDMQQNYNDEKIKIARAKLLPERKEKLAKINVTIEDDVILLMDNVEFDKFYNEKNSLYLEEQNKILQEQQEKIKRDEELKKAKEEERKKVEEEKKLEIQKQKDKLKKEKELRKQQEIEAKEEAEKAKEKAEKEKIEAVEAEKKRNEEQKQNEIKLKELEEKADKEKQERLEKEVKYRKFLEDNGCNKDTKDQFKILKENNQVFLCKIVSIFNIN